MPNWEEIRRILVRAATSNGSPDPEGAAQDVITRLLASGLEPPSRSIEMYFYVAGRSEARNQIRKAKVNREISLTQQFKGASYSATLTYPFVDVDRLVDFRNRFDRFLEILNSTKPWHRGGRYNPRLATMEDLLFVRKYMDSDGRPSATDRARARRCRIRLRRAWELSSRGDPVAGPAVPSRRPN